MERIPTTTKEIRQALLDARIYNIELVKRGTIYHYAGRRGLFEITYNDGSPIKKLYRCFMHYWINEARQAVAWQKESE